MFSGASKSPQSGIPPRQRGIFVYACLASMARSAGKYPIPGADLWTVSSLLAAMLIVAIPSKESEAMSKRTCKKCGSIKPISDFYSRQCFECKECSKKRIRENRAANLNYYREFDRNRSNLPHRIAARKAYAETEKGKEARRRANVNYLKNFPEKRRKTIQQWQENNPKKRDAHIAVQLALYHRILTKAPCESCGNLNVHAHHDDYLKPLNVRWLCAIHHRQWHSLHGEGKNG